ncbi:MAG: polysaccharide pyruvyl transferase CsaB [Propionibacteriaceae bacterium]|nr:polysaccharide pyruvyl transferase CsaB [Propionibacteriaceae bacterium]
MSGLALSSPPRCVLLCGYYGEHNLGDDALLEVLIRQLPEGWQPVITAFDSEAVREMVPNAAVINRRSLNSTLKSIREVEAVVLGGGSLLQDSTSFRSLIYYIIIILAARIRSKPVILWGQGLGPLKKSLSRFLVSRALNYASSITWRDAASMELAYRLKIKTPMTMAPDPVWTHQTTNHQGGGDIVLCWRPSKLLNENGWTLLLKALEQLCHRTGLSVTWLAFHALQDADLFQSLRGKGLISDTLAKKSTTIIANNIEQANDIFSDASLVIAMRLHALILAISSQCPTVGLSYDPKVEAAARTAGAAWSSLDNLPDLKILVSQWITSLSTAPSISRLHAIRNESHEHERMLKISLSNIQ